VEKSVLAKSQSLATKADVQKIEDKMQAQFYFMLGGFLTVILAILALMATLLPAINSIAAP